MLTLTRSRARNAFVGMNVVERLGVLGLLVLVAGVVGILRFSAGGTGRVLTAAAFLVYLGTLALPFIVYRRSWGWFHPLVFTVLWVELFRGTLPRLRLFGAGLSYHRALPGWSTGQLNALVTEVLLLQAIGMLSLYAGFLIVPRMKVPEVRFPEPKALFTKVLVIGGLSGVALLVLVGHAGGLGSLLLQRGLASDQRIASQIGSHWHLMAVLLRTACLVWLAVQPGVWRTGRFWIVFVLSLLMGFIATGSRSDVVIPVIMALAIWCLQQRRIPYTRGLLVALMGFAALGFLGEFRSATAGAGSIDEVEVESTVTEGVLRGVETMVSYSTEVAGTFGIVGRVPSEVDYLLGQSYIAVLTAPIPRALWSGKPTGAGKLTGARIFGITTGTAIPPATLGEAYWNFSVPGVILIYFLWGLFLKWLACLFDANPRDRGVMLIFVLSIFLFQPNTDSIFNYLLELGPAMIVLLFFCGLPRVVPSRSRSPLELTEVR